MNITDVARKAGVSKTTVSRVLAGSDSVKLSTKERVLEVIDKMGYTPNTSAQMLAGGRNRVIGIINDTGVSDPFYGYVNDLLASKLRKHGYNVIYTTAPNKGESCNREIAMLYGKVDAFIFTGDIHDHDKQYREGIEKLIMSNIPVALFKAGIRLEHALSVDVDNEAGGEMAYSFLAAKKYKRIGYMHGSENAEQIDFYEGMERERGFATAAFRNHEQNITSFYCSRDFKKAYATAKDVIDSGIDALFCETDLMAYGVIEGITDMGYKVPDRVAIIGFDGFKFSNYETMIKLTTILQPLTEMADYVCEQLIAQIGTGGAFLQSKNKIFMPTIIRGKTA